MTDREGQVHGEPLAADQPEAPNFTAGDLVVLRSGGPMLTIAEISGEHARCIWFDNSDMLQRAELPLSCLDPADGSELLLSGEGEEDELDWRADGEDDYKKKKKKKNRD